MQKIAKVCKGSISPNKMMTTVKTVSSVGNDNGTRDASLLLQVTREEVSNLGTEGSKGNSNRIKDFPSSNVVRGKSAKWNQKPTKGLSHGFLQSPLVTSLGDLTPSCWTDFWHSTIDWERSWPITVAQWPMIDMMGQVIHNYLQDT